MLKSIVTLAGRARPASPAPGATITPRVTLDHLSTHPEAPCHCKHARVNGEPPVTPAATLARLLGTSSRRTRGSATTLLDKKVSEQVRRGGDVPVPRRSTKKQRPHHSGRRGARRRSTHNAQGEAGGQRRSAVAKASVTVEAFDWGGGHHLQGHCVDRCHRGAATTSTSRRLPRSPLRAVSRRVRHRCGGTA